MSANTERQTIITGRTIAKPQGFSSWSATDRAVWVNNNESSLKSTRRAGHWSADSIHGVAIKMKLVGDVSYVQQTRFNGVWTDVARYKLEV